MQSIKSDRFAVKPLKNKFNLKKNSVYTCNINIRDSHKYSAPRLLGTTEIGDVIIKRDISKDGEMKTIFVTDEQDCSITFSVALDHKIKVENLYAIASSIEVILIEKKRNTKLITNEKTVCVAMASYPSRKKSLLETIESLIRQTDYLLLYLNEYKEIPEEIESSIYRGKIICIVDEDGSRKAEGKFHWLHRVTGYYLTCDDDIIYPSDYVEKTVENIEKYNRECIVGYHGIIFNNSVASFNADKKAFFKFTESLKENTTCHLLGTGVSGCHSKLFKKIDTTLLSKYSFAVDPALSVICKKNKIKMICLKHEESWLQSSSHMLYGLHEEKQIYIDKKKAVDKLLQRNNPWDGRFLSMIMSKLKSNIKLRKLINDPRRFITDSKYIKFFKKQK